MNHTRQASLSITNSRSSLRLMSIESVMPSSHLILCHPLFLLPPIPPSIRVFSNESPPAMRWPKYWTFSFSISPSNEHPGLISFRMDWLDLLALPGTLKSLQHHSSKASTPLYLIQRGMFSLRPTQSLEVSSFLCPAPSFCNVYLRTWWGGRHPQTLPPGPQPGRSGHGTWGHASWPWGGTCPPCPSPTLEFTQIHVHRVSDAIQPSHPLSSPSPPAPSPSQHQGLMSQLF